MHVVRKQEVGLKFNKLFSAHTPASLYRVRFKLNRLPLRRQHQALDTAFAPARLLFPTAANNLNGPTRPPGGSGLTMFNSLIANNPPQMQAVASILRLPQGSPPFVVFGP